MGGVANVEMLATPPLIVVRYKGDVDVGVFS